MAFGRLDSPRHDAPIGDINVTPLVDVMLVLVVIFILTAPLLTSAIRLDLPRGAAKPGGEAPPAVVLVVDAQGQTYIDDRVLTAAALEQRLRQVARDHAETELQLRADVGLPYGRLVEVMNLAQQAGLSRIGFVVRPAATAKP
ncbi:MAG: biopolymer transporter ExbD [Rhodoferax sp.]|nr:biopolymer transporter ExbD [Rhodoferax sp.]